MSRFIGARKATALHGGRGCACPPSAVACRVCGRRPRVAGRPDLDESRRARRTLPWLWRGLVPSSVVGVRSWNGQSIEDSQTRCRANLLAAAVNQLTIRRHCGNRRRLRKVYVPPESPTQTGDREDQPSSFRVFARMPQAIRSGWRFHGVPQGA